MTLTARQKVVRQGVEVYVGQITSAYRRTLDDILSLGYLLIEAKAELDHGEFQRMIEERLPFGPNYARRFMRLTRHPVISNGAHAHALPADVTALDHLSKIKEPKALEALIDSGEVTPELKRGDAYKLWKIWKATIEGCAPVCAMQNHDHGDGPTRPGRYDGLPVKDYLESRRLEGIWRDLLRFLAELGAADFAPSKKDIRAAEETAAALLALADDWRHLGNGSGHTRDNEQ